MSMTRICYGCTPPDRHVGCHATCEKYLKEREEALKGYEKHLQEREVIWFSVEGIRRNRTAGAGMNRKQYRGTGRNDGQ